MPYFQFNSTKRERTKNIKNRTKMYCVYRVWILMNFFWRSTCMTLNLKKWFLLHELFVFVLLFIEFELNDFAILYRKENGKEKKWIENTIDNSRIIYATLTLKKQTKSLAKRKIVVWMRRYQCICPRIDVNTSVHFIFFTIK